MSNTILIAEDERASLCLLETYFSEAGSTVYTAESCRDALKLLCRHLPGCFILDYHLGDNTADPVCLAIRTHERLKKAPIVILSGDPSQAAYSYDTCQADVFLDKDKSYPEIVAAVKRHLRRRDASLGLMWGSDLTLDSKNMSVLREGKPAVCLSPEQFRFFSFIFKKSPRFTSEEELCRQVFLDDCSTSMRKALNMVAYRLRIKLGPQLARRIKCGKTIGWVYLQPRDRKKDQPAAEKTAPADKILHPVFIGKTPRITTPARLTNPLRPPKLYPWFGINTIALYLPLRRTP